MLLEVLLECFFPEVKTFRRKYDTMYMIHPDRTVGQDGLYCRSGRIVL